ncbi:serine/threonine protein kinase [Rhodopirellula rubra]|uniref:Serine/threonine protein kinase n=1 Tax=Aporhodopirellula rubra TaxID=980271 RepID=A0A7W5E124_9BACT|nr:serine/threonine-protein kinase [Aporhodopirellula rubra]MBB3208233.1 serine/threonine protein kinase [Aporhodopirellula rubra]
MNNSRGRNEDLQRIKPILSDLFDQGDPSQAYDDNLESDDDICPLYCSISRIKQRYQDPELIGRGGMKEVYRVYDARAVRHVAMAKPLPKFSSDQYDAFLREAHLTARLNHPNIIDLFDMDIDQQGRPFFTMELRHGQSLLDVIRSLRDDPAKNEIPLHQRLELFLRVCDAVAYAHSRRVLHLDIKPENIFVGDYGEVKVCDWGMGVVMAREQGESESAVLLDPDLYGSLLQSVSGTPIYMAPEQKDTRQHKTPQMDIYALGCLLQELLTLKAPSQSKSANSGIDPPLAATIAKAMAMHPSDRYQEVALLRQDISRFLLGYSTSVERASLRREAALFYRRHRDACSIALGSLAILTMCVTFFIWQLSESRERALTAKAVAVDARAHAQEAQSRAIDAKQVAEDAQQKTAAALERAEEAQRQAEASLAKYLAEKRESDRRRYSQIVAAARHSEFVIDAAMQRDDEMRSALQFALVQLDSILDFDPPPNSFAWNQKFWNLFLIQDFEAALDLSAAGKEITPELVMLAERYLPHRNADGFVDTAHFISLMQDLVTIDRWRAPLAEKMMLYDGIHDRTHEDKLAITRAWVQLNNPNWQGEELSYDPDSATVRLRGIGVKHLNRTFAAASKRHPNRFCLLHVLKPKVLDLRETSIRDLSELRSLQLLELDIRQTPVKDLSPLLNNRTLRRLYLDPDAIPESQIASLPESIEVIRGDRDTHLGPASD